MELTIGSKTLATAFFIAEVQGNYNLILGRDWIHANQCVPSTLHQFLVQWIGDEVEVIHGHTSSFVAWPIPILLVHMTTSSVYRAWICPIMI